MPIDLPKLLPSEGPFTYEKNAYGQTVLFTRNDETLRVKLHVSDELEWRLLATNGEHTMNAGGMFTDTPASLEKTELTLQALCDNLIYYPVRLEVEREWPFTLMKLQVNKENDWKDVLVTRSRNRLRT